MEFSNTLITWYLQNRRELPWRKTSNPYPIWLSEIMLQQTRVAQGMPYYFSFMEAFPTIRYLADAPEEQVLRLWQGLGYYSRARNLHATAKYIAYELDGIFPPDYAGLLRLKGVGEYTAAAIASIAYGEEVPVVDGNVYRVLSRYFGIDQDISAPAAKKVFTAIAARHLPAGKASEFNQAMMEFGALQCVPRNPACGTCPLNAACAAFAAGRVHELPVKLRKTKVTSRYFNYLVVKDSKNAVLIEKRTQKGIWHSLYQFPLIETAADTTPDAVTALIADAGIQADAATLALVQDNIVHKLSHQHLHIRFWEICASGVLPAAVAPQELHRYPFPVVIHNFIVQHWQL